MDNGLEHHTRCGEDSVSIPTRISLVIVHASRKGVSV